MSAGRRAMSDGRKAVGPVLAVIALLSLLLAFAAVVLHLERGGVSRRQAVALHADGVWRCNTLQGRTRRDACVLALEDAAAGGTQRAARVTP
jgi:hypothetical protein